MDTSSAAVVPANSKPVHTLPTLTHPAKKDEFPTLPLKWLQASKTNPRKQFDGPEFDELVASVERQGVLVPLLVRPVGGAGSDASLVRYEVIAGERRYRAATKLGLVNVPVRIMDLNDEETLEVQIVENLQRKDVQPIEEARGYRTLLDVMSKASPLQSRNDQVTELAKRVGKSVRYVYARMKLTDLVPAAIEKLDRGKLSPSHADELVRLQPKDQEKALKFCFEDKWDHGHVEKDAPVSVRTLRDRIQSGFYIDLKKANWKLDDCALVPAAGACSACPKRAGVDGEGDKNSHCVDRACFASKQQAFVQLRIANERGGDETTFVLKLSWRYSSAKPKQSRDGDMDHISGLDSRQVFKRGQWVEAKKGECSTVFVGITIDEDKSWERKGQPGVRKFVCVAPACKKHPKEYADQKAAVRASDDSWEKQQKDRKEREAKEEPLRLLLVNKIVDQVQKLGPREIRFIVQGDPRFSFHDDALQARFKLKGEKAVEARLDMLDPMGKEYAQIVIFAVLSDFLNPNGYDKANMASERKELLAVCELFGVKDAEALAKAHDAPVPQTSAKSSPTSPKAPAVKKSSPKKAKASSKKGGRK